MSAVTSSTHGCTIPTARSTSVPCGLDTLSSLVSKLGLLHGWPDLSLADWYAPQMQTVWNEVFYNHSLIVDFDGSSSRPESFKADTFQVSG